MIPACTEHASFTTMKESGVPLDHVASRITVECLGSRWREWDDCVKEWPAAGFFHHSSWMRALSDVYGHTPKPMVFRRDGALVGLIPMVEVNSPFTGRRGVALPFADECAPLIAASLPETGLESALFQHARAAGWNSVEVRGSNAGFHPVVPSMYFRGHRVKLSTDIQCMWERLKAPFRTAIRKAEASKVYIEVSQSIQSLREFYQIYGMTRQRHGHPLQPFSFFEAIFRQVIEAGRGDIVLARANGRCIAGAVFFHTGSRVLFKYGAYDTRFQDLRANNLVLWTGLQHYGRAGHQVMELGRTSVDNEGLCRFKEGLGAVEYRIDYGKYDLHSDRYVEEKDQAAGWHTWIFRFAPRWASSLAGKILYKHLA